MKLIFEHQRMPRSQTPQTWVRLEPIPAYFCMVSHFGASQNTEDGMRSELKRLFNITLEQTTNVFLSKCYHGRDRRGLFCIKQHFWPSQKRPKRIRFQDMAKAWHEAYVSNPAEHAYDNSTVRTIYECCNCHRTGYKDQWPWRYVAGLANSDYISECPNCKERAAGDILEKILEADTKRLRIRRHYDHDAPYIFPSSQKYKEVILLGRGRVAVQK